MQHSNFFDNYDIDQTDTQSDFNTSNFYQIAYQLLEHFYPTKTVTIGSRDQPLKLNYAGKINSCGPDGPKKLTLSLSG